MRTHSYGDDACHSIDGMTPLAMPMTDKSASVVNASVRPATLQASLRFERRAIVHATAASTIATSRPLAAASATPIGSGVCASGPTRVPTVLVRTQSAMIAALPSTPDHQTIGEGDLSVRSAHTSWATPLPTKKTP